MRLDERRRSSSLAGSATREATVQRGHILIVDDEPNVRFVFRTALESVGHTVEEASDGHEALRRLHDLTPDVVLLDLRMPDLDGMSVLQRLRDDGNDVPVVVVTAHGSVPDAVAAMKLGAIDFLAKPLTPESLRKVVSEVIARHAAEPEEEEASAVATHGTTVTLAPPLFDLTPVKLALNRRQFDRAADLLKHALDADPDSAEAHTLMGVLQESRGQNHTAYHSYKAALEADPNYQPALDNLRLYCERFGLDVNNPKINPAAH
jgi:DNA-binding response OmpR family regulator